VTASFIFLPLLYKAALVEGKIDLVGDFRFLLNAVAIPESGVVAGGVVIGFLADDVSWCIVGHERILLANILILLAVFEAAQLSKGIVAEKDRPYMLMG
jgi:hypothetical protein